MSKNSRRNKIAANVAKADQSQQENAPTTPAPSATNAAPTSYPANASLPARPIKTVAGDAASARFKGIGTLAPEIPSGLRRNEFQDRLLELNESKGMHKSDDELAVLMDREFPFGGVRIADRPELVQVIRKFYNAGTHGKQQGGTKPATPSLQYEKPVDRRPQAAPQDDEQPIAQTA